MRKTGKFKTRLPNKQYDEIFQQGRECALNGYERRSPWSDCRGEVPWLDGFDSVFKIVVDRDQTGSIPQETLEDFLTEVKGVVK